MARAARSNGFKLYLIKIVHNRLAKNIYGVMARSIRSIKLQLASDGLLSAFWLAIKGSQDILERFIDEVVFVPRYYFLE